MHTTPMRRNTPMTTMQTPAGGEIAELREAIRGTMLAPGDPGYDEARTLWKAMFYDSADRAHSPQRHSPGQGFVEPPNRVHLARSEGRKEVVVLVGYLGLKHGFNPDVSAANPGNRAL
jgi:hypothetical protein